MPWNTDDGGKQQGPWGQPPRNQNNRPGGGNKGGGGGGGLPPEFDDFIQKGKDSLKGALPGSGGGTAWLLPLLLIGAYWLYSSVYQVQPDQRGVVLRLGKYTRTADPGLHFALWPFETMETPRVGAVQQINIGNDGGEGLMLTSDKNIISVPFSLQWRISDPKNFLFNVADQEQMIRVLAQSAMREVVGQTRAQLILTTGKDTVATQVQVTTQKLLDENDAGVLLTAVNLGDVQPPPEVKDAFDEVVRAGQEQIRLENDAQQTRNQKTQLAAGEAAKLIEDANAYKAAQVADAQGQAARFLSVYEQYKNAKDVTRRRIFLETLEQVLSQSNNTIIENGNGGQGVVPYLPLPEVQRRTSGTETSTQGQ